MIFYRLWESLKMKLTKQDKGPKEYAVVEAFDLSGGFGAGERNKIICFILELEDIKFFSKTYIEGPGRFNEMVLNKYGKKICRGRDYCRIHKLKVVDLAKIKK
jgi:hypothetical protein